MTVQADFSKMEVFKARAQVAAAAGLTQVAIAMQGKMRAKMTKSTGRKPSAPGQPPAVQTGALRNSVVHQPATAANLIARVGTNLPYGKWLEFGFTMPVPKLSKPNKKTGVRLPIRSFKGADGKRVIWVQTEPVKVLARPWLGPVRLEYSTGTKAQNVFAAAFKRALKAGTA